MSLGHALFSGVQQRVLAVLFGAPDKSFYRNELMRLTGSGKGALQRELDRLEQSGLVTVRPQGNQKHYQANSYATIFEELRSIVMKTLALPAHAAHEQRAAYEADRAPPVPKRELAKLCRKYRIRKLSLFGSAARGELKPGSDVDLMVEFDPRRTPSLWEFPEMEKDFSRLFGGRKVDLVPPQVLANRHRRESIERDLKLLYAA